MGIVTKPTVLTDGVVPTAAQFNGDYDTLYNDYNGNIDNSNIKAAAGITESKLAFSGSGHGHTGGTDGKSITASTPEGFLINGKITTSVSSNNLVVAIKTLAGTDPTATDIVTIRIGNSLRNITAALSLTLAAGTSWMNMGQTELATQDVDIFVYLGYRTSDTSVFLALSRIPYGRVYSDFSATTTAENYLGYSGSAPAATDEVEVAGRCNATLSAGAGYTWTIPATSIVINRPIFATRWLTWTPVFGGFSANPTGNFYYQITNRICMITQETPSGDGTSNAASFTITVPIGSSVANSAGGTLVLVKDNSVLSDTPGYMRFSTTGQTLTFLKSNSSGNFTSSGTKDAYWSFYSYKTT